MTPIHTEDCLDCALSIDPMMHPSMVHSLWRLAASELQSLIESESRVGECAPVSVGVLCRYD